MIILTIKTDQPEAQIALFNDYSKIKTNSWVAHKQLADTIHLKIKELLEQNNINFKDISGIVGYMGPGSFTGLRIGLTVANTIAYGLNIPIVGFNGDSWQNDGIKALLGNNNHKIVIPEYGREANITLPKK